MGSETSARYCIVTCVTPASQSLHTAMPLNRTYQHHASFITGVRTCFHDCLILTWPPHVCCASTARAAMAQRRRQRAAARVANDLDAQLHLKPEVQISRGQQHEQAKKPPSPRTDAARHLQPQASKQAWHRGKQARKTRQVRRARILAILHCACLIRRVGVGRFSRSAARKP